MTEETSTSKIKRLLPQLILPAEVIIAIIIIILAKHRDTGVWPQWPAITGFRGKTLWDVLGLIIVPASLAAAALWFAYLERKESDKRADQADANERARQRDTVLQIYLDKMSDFISDQKDEASTRPYLKDAAYKLAQVRTVTTLRQLDAFRRDIIFQFFRDTGLSEYILANGAKMSKIDLSKSDISSIWMPDADLTGAILTEANLSASILNGADLSGANLIGANLSRTNLTYATITSEQLGQAKSLKGATLPDGTIHD